MTWSVKWNSARRAALVLMHDSTCEEFLIVSLKPASCGQKIVNHPTTATANTRTDLPAAAMACLHQPAEYQQLFRQSVSLPVSAARIAISKKEGRGRLQAQDNANARQQIDNGCTRKTFIQ
jgi:hypothetical protein